MFLSETLSLDGHIVNHYVIWTAKPLFICFVLR